LYGIRNLDEEELGTRIQVKGGDPLGTDRGGPGYEFKDELHPGLRFASLGMLIEAAQRCGSEIALRIVAASPAALRPIQLTGLHGYLELHPTVNDALATLGS
jgi:hypothetical protein